MDEKDSIIVLSGGMDSVTLLYEFRANIALAVTFDYGSNHNRRADALRASGHRAYRDSFGFYG